LYPSPTWSGASYKHKLGRDRSLDSCESDWGKIDTLRMQN
jgi:hypothetical protein